MVADVVGAPSMQVTHVYKDYFPPVYGGIEQHLNALCGGLTARGVKVRVLVANRRLSTSVEDHDGVRVIRAACLGRLASAPLSVSLPLWIRRLDRETDVYHFHFPNPVGEVAAVCGMTRRPYVVTYHSDIVRQRYAMPVYAVPPHRRRALCGDSLRHRHAVAHRGQRGRRRRVAEKTR
jgi:O-antigen biosynthesis rhamnosyltransferase